LNEAASYDQVADWLFHLRQERELAKVANLATVGPNSRFDTLRPAPSRLMSDAPDLDTPQVHGLYLALVKRSCFFRSIKALFHDLCHVALPIQIPSDLVPSSCRKTSSFCFAPKHRARDQPIFKLDVMQFKKEKR
jgi:hypothetical protein